jgi:hypothetical protein
MAMLAVVVGSPAQAATFSFGFCAPIERYDQAVWDWILVDSLPNSTDAEVTQAKQKVKMSRSQALSAIKRDGSGPAAQLLPPWKLYNYFRTTMSSTRRWQDAGARSAQLLSVYCGLSSAPAPWF